MEENAIVNGRSIYRGRQRAVVAGCLSPVLVNLSIGIASPDHIGAEEAKIDSLLRHSESQPDLMMDLSIAASTPEPWELLVDRFGGPVGVIPHYLLFDARSGLAPQEVVRRIDRLIEGGIAFLTLHIAVTRSLVEKAVKMRRTPVTSRGGSVVIRDMLLNNRPISLYATLLDDILPRLAEKHVVLNLGTTFRAATIVDGFDDVAREEVNLQEEFIERARAAGVMVTLEGPGHVTFRGIDDYVKASMHLHVPMMPLGPMVTDAHPTQDHVVNAIGAAYMMTKTRGGIINTVTSAEHLGGIPNVRLLREALEAARAAAHAATLTYCSAAVTVDDTFATRRAEFHTCVVGIDADPAAPPVSFHAGCTRCGALCPLTTELSANP